MPARRPAGGRDGGRSRRDSPGGKKDRRLGAAATGGRRCSAGSNLQGRTRLYRVRFASIPFQLRQESHLPPAPSPAVMLRLRNCILTCLRSSPATSPAPPLHRLLSAAAAAPAAFPNTTFVVEDYLVDTCGLSRAQALKASSKLSHFKSASKPDAVLAFLAGLGLSTADVAAVVAKDPQILCAKVEKTLGPVLFGLTGLGLSHTDIARLVSLAPDSFRCRTIVSNVQYCLPIFGSVENLLRTVERDSHFLSSSLERVVKPNVALLEECGLGVCDITKLTIAIPRMLTSKLERLQAAVACAEALGAPRGSAMFRHALQTAGFLSKENITTRVDYLKKTLRWSDAEVGIALSKLPSVLKKSKDTVQCRSDFLISEVGLEQTYIAHRPALLTYSLEGRLKPRYYAVKFLKENGLIKRDPSYFTVAKVTEKVFVGGSYALTRKMRHTSVKTMRPLAEGKCQLDSDLYEPRTAYGSW